ncbi:MAG: T9SS type A sorting domain-containing protein [Saprospiraceae bacterium]|nr:T9SS type A sorting domain-containing protein [Saprospiraceae bacterium]
MDNLTYHHPHKSLNFAQSAIKKDAEILYSDHKRPRLQICSIVQGFGSLKPLWILLFIVFANAMAVAQRCSVNILKEKTENGYILFFRTESSSAEAIIKSINWSTGSSDEKIRVNTNGKYCIRIAFDNGCVAEKCLEIGDLGTEPTRCGIDFKKEEQNGRVFICVYSTNPNDEIKEVRWANGSNDRCIPYSSIGSASFCVKVITKNGCELSKCLEGDPPVCKVEIERVIRDNGGIYLRASPGTEGVKSFQWSNGSTERCIPLPSDLKEICVKAFFGNGCIASDCVPTGEACRLEIVRKTDESGNIVLCAETSSVSQNYRIKWSTGDTTKCIRVPTQLKEVCAVAVFANGCEIRKCITLVNTDCKIEIVRKTDDAGNVFLCAVGNSSTAPVRYKWSNGDTTSCIRWDKSVEKYCITAEFRNGCIAEDCIMIDVPGCAVKIVRSTDEKGNIVLCADTGPTDELKRYFWSTGDSTACIKIRPEFKGELCVKVLDSNGCWARDCINIRPEECKIVITQKRDAEGLTYLCAGPLSNTKIRVVWNTGDTSDCIVVKEDGYYCAKAYFPNGCETSACIMVGEDTCKVGIRQARVENGFLLSATARKDASFKYIQWSTNENTQTIFVDKTGEYCVKVELENGCVATACIKVELPSCQVIIVREGNRLFAKTSGEGDKYLEWSTGETTREILITTLTKYCVKYVDASGCVAEACIDLSPRGVKDNNTGEGNNSSSQGDLNTFVEEGIDVFPNPVSDRFYLRANNLPAASYQYQVISSAGQLISQGNIALNDAYSIPLEIDTNSWDSGIYIIRMWSADRIFYSRFMKQ